MPRAYIEMILSSKPVKRVWPLPTIFGSNVPLRSRGVSSGSSPKSPQRLGGLAIARVAAVVAGLVVLRVAQMIGHLGLHGSLQERFGELLQQPMLADNIFRALIVRQQFVNQVKVDGHRVSLV